MTRSRVSRIGLAAAAVALAVVAALAGFRGGAMFSPGDLNAGDVSRENLGGVTSHAELSRECSSCHAPPGSARPMRARCLECHSDIRKVMNDSSALHGRLPSVRECMSCHTEHRGAAGQLTRSSGFGSAHNTFGFPLDGAHARTPCAACHKHAAERGDFRNAPKTCIGCHLKDDRHRGTFGTDCAACHSTTRWGDARVSHDVFPIDHGGNPRGDCKTCHENPKNFKQYTCYNCHEHSRDRVARQHREEVGGRNLDNCLECHRNGSREGGEHGEGGEREGRRGRD